MTATPIPKAAVSMRDYIRKHVGRPVDMPMPVGGCLRFIRFLDTGVDRNCAMGLLSKANVGTPVGRRCFDNLPRYLTDKNITAFADWWDRQTNPKTAVDAVWGAEARPPRGV